MTATKRCGFAFVKGTKPLPHRVWSLVFCVFSCVHVQCLQPCKDLWETRKVLSPKSCEVRKCVRVCTCVCAYVCGCATLSGSVTPPAAKSCFCWHGDVVFFSWNTNEHSCVLKLMCVLNSMFVSFWMYTCESVHWLCVSFVCGPKWLVVKPVAGVFKLVFHHSSWSILQAGRLTGWLVGNTE